MAGAEPLYMSVVAKKVEPHAVHFHITRLKGDSPVLPGAPPVTESDADCSTAVGHSTTNVNVCLPGQEEVCLIKAL